MPLLILGKKIINSRTNYSGIYRESPSYDEHLPETHPANLVFLRYLDAVDDALFLHDEETARNLVVALNNVNERSKFELIKFDYGQRNELDYGDFWGYDISAGHYSLLSWGLHLINADDSASTVVSTSPVQCLLKLIEAHFYPKLNSHGLFDIFEDAVFCLECMMAIQELAPNLWENEEVIFKVVRIHKLA